MTFTPKTIGQLRHLATTSGTILASSGVIGQDDAANWQTAIGALITLVSFVASYFAPEKK